jgi:hypothetical protein
MAATVREAMALFPQTVEFRRVQVLFAPNILANLVSNSISCSAMCLRSRFYVSRMFGWAWPFRTRASF